MYIEYTSFFTTCYCQVNLELIGHSVQKYFKVIIIIIIHYCFTSLETLKMFFLKEINTLIQQWSIK